MHLFHIPVMGTGHTADSPVRVAPYGISSVISIVDDLLLERIRKQYCREFNLSFSSISRNAEDGRARRITEYLDLVQDLVTRKFEEIRNQPFFEENEKAKYFRMLPDMSPLKQAWNQLIKSGCEMDTELREDALSRAMQPGSIDVNIMAKVDRLTYDADGNDLGPEFSDGSASLRGFANSKLTASLVLSAGFNPRLYGYLASFKDFYRDATGEIRKKIILKVSDFRSALIQGRFLAKKGLEVHEYRIESGLNCGGHAFPADGQILPAILAEFRDKRDQLGQAFESAIRAFYTAQGWDYVSSADSFSPKVTVQGGVGTHGEMMRLVSEYGADSVGWGSPFLLVPEATTVDEPTMALLAGAGEKELYLSNASPLGVPFNNIKGSGSQRWTEAQIRDGKPGSPCPKGFLQTNTEFTEKPICTASKEYQALKLAQLEETYSDPVQLMEKKEEVLAKTCLCDHLGNGALITLGIIPEKHGKQSICPGPNMAWFNRKYSLEEMVNHIYGRINLVPAERPHMFAKELDINLNYFAMQYAKADPADAKGMAKFQTIAQNLLAGAALCREIAQTNSYNGENMTSLITQADKTERQVLLIWPELLVTA